MDMRAMMDALKTERPIFHSEADFQFALAWAIKERRPAAAIRLEYPPPKEPNRYIDILVQHRDDVYPIELKYKTKALDIPVKQELFHLKDHGAQDLGAYDFVKDICRVEQFGAHLAGSRKDT